MAVHKPCENAMSSPGTSDLAGQMVGAFAATAMVFQQSDPAYYATLMDSALKLYGAAIKNRG